STADGASACTGADLLRAGPFPSGPFSVPALFGAGAFPCLRFSVPALFRAGPDEGLRRPFSYPKRGGGASSLAPILKNDWGERLADEFEKPYYQELRRFLIEEYRTRTI